MVLGSISTAITQFESKFPSKELASTNKVPNKLFSGSKLTELGVARLVASDFDYKVSRRRGRGKISGKTIPVTLESSAPVDQSPSQALANLIKSRYAYLLRPQPDGTFVIDTTELSGVKMRKRYVPLGCKITVSKDLSTATVSDTASSAPPSKIQHIAQISLSVFSLIVSAVVNIYYALANQFGWSVRTSPAPADATSKDTTPSITQKTLWPFQVGLPQFIERVDKYLLGQGNLLYHLTGMEYESLVSFMKNKLANVSHVLPQFELPELASLPIIELGKQYWVAIKAWVENSIEKGELVAEELSSRLKGLSLPADWSTVDQLTYTLWNLTFHNTLILHAVKESFTKVGSVLTHDGHTVFVGLQEVLKAFEHFFILESTKLVATASFSKSAALARKMISTKVYIENTHADGVYDFLRPDNVSITLV